MADSLPQLTAPPSDLIPHKYQRVLEYLENVPTQGSHQVPVLPPVLQLSGRASKDRLTPHGPAQPQPDCEPVQEESCLKAVPGQRLLLEDLNNDVLSIIVEFVFENATQYRPMIPQTSFDSREIGSTVFCLSLTSKRMRTVCIPRLFQKISRLTYSMGDLNRRLRDIEGNPLLPLLPTVLWAVKACDIITTSRGDTTFCRTRLAKVLPKMESLTELSVTHRKDVDISGLSKTFRRERVILNTITHLRIVSHGSWAFLVQVCPNIQTLGLAYNLAHKDLMRAAKNLEHLKTLEICNHSWRNSDIRKLHRFFSRIQSLVLRGRLGDRCINRFSDVFGLFQRLTYLAITVVHQITDKDLEGYFSDDCSGSDSIVEEIEYENEFNECRFLIIESFFKDCPKLRWVSLLGKYLHDKWTPERLYDEYPEAAHLISLKPRAASNEAPGEKEVLGVDRLKYDYEGFIQLFSFPRPASYGDESMDPSYYDVHDDRPANWKEELERYMAIKEDATSLGLWE